MVRKRLHNFTSFYMPLVVEELVRGKTKVETRRTILDVFSFDTMRHFSKTESFDQEANCRIFDFFAHVMMFIKVYFITKAD